jgi:hypothetical protein
LVHRYIEKKAAAARSTGLRPIHFSNRGNSRDSQLWRLLQNCNVWQNNFVTTGSERSHEANYVKMTKAGIAAAICAVFFLSAAVQGAEQPGEKVDMKSLPTSVQQTINQQVAGGEIVQVKREDDANGKWNYEVIVRTNGKESAFEVDPNGKLVKKHTEIKR